MALFCLPFTFTACGSDDENGSGKNVDGVDVINEKRLVELQIERYDGNMLPEVYKVKYDSRGRMYSILYRPHEYKYENGKEVYVYSNEFSEIVSIDYDLRTLKIVKPYYSSNRSYSYQFTLNEDGFISQIGSTTFYYDSNGRLIDVKVIRGIGSLFYDSDDLIKASFLKMNSGNMYMYYISYENVDNQGDLFINIHNDDKRYFNLDKESIISFIAYQSGLLGKVAKTFIHLKSRSETFSIINADNSSYYNRKISFVFE